MTRGQSVWVSAAGALSPLTVLRIVANRPAARRDIVLGLECCLQRVHPPLNRPSSLLKPVSKKFAGSKLLEFGLGVIVDLRCEPFTVLKFAESRPTS